mgnify:CR=1 FL=1|tara:strand:+ start:3173 stop:3292 length:120 start_codon:yes stop_codon:yes gene_type:complete
MINLNLSTHNFRDAAQMGMRTTVGAILCTQEDSKDTTIS